MKRNDLNKKPKDYRSLIAPLVSSIHKRRKEYIKIKTLHVFIPDKKGCY